MKITLSPFRRFLAIILVAVILSTAIGPLPLNSASAQATKCGQWLVQIVNVEKEKRITATLINGSSSGDNYNCLGVMTMTNKTSINWLGGGYIMEITTSANNATLIGSDTKFLLPSASAPMDIRAVPIDPASLAGVSVKGAVTPKSYVFDASLFLFRSLLKLIPGPELAACGIDIGGGLTRDALEMAFITNNWEDIVLSLNRGSEVIANAVVWTANGDFLGGKRELLRVLPQFFESFIGAVMKQSVKCVFALISKALKVPGAYISIIISYFTWVPVVGWHYFQYEGNPAQVNMIYTPVIVPTKTPAPTETPTTQPTAATCTTLRGVVLPEKVSCRYGPGAMYLYLYGMVQGANQDIIGRNGLGTWVLTRARGDTTSCWVKTDLMKINGDVMCLEPIDPDNFRLPRSPYYGPVTDVSASRSGNNVVISWTGITLRPDMDSLQTPYVIEAWVCRAGRLIFEPTGSYTTSATIVDESGCSERSHGRVMAAEKHGYTKWVEIPWP